MSSNKTKNPVWTIVIIAVFGLMALVTAYNLYYWVKILPYKDPLPLRSLEEMDIQVWYTTNNRLLFYNWVFINHHLSRYVYKHWELNRALFGLCSLSLLVACVLSIVTRSNKNKAVTIAFAAFAVIQLLYYGMEFFQIITIFTKAGVKIQEWAYALSNTISHTYLWECLWRMLVSVIILLFALKNFVPAIDNLLSGSLKNVLFNSFTVVFLCSLLFLPFNTHQWINIYHENKFLYTLPFYLSALGLVCQSAIFTWFIKE